MRSTRIEQRVNTWSTENPPHNIELEQGLLGALLSDNQKIDEVADLLTPQSFYDPLHTQIFELAVRLHSAGKVANAITLKPYFAEHPPIDKDMSVPQYLARLMIAACVPQSIPHYARTILDLARRRELIELAESIKFVATQAPIDKPAEELIADTEQALARITQDSNEREWITLGQAVAKAIEKINIAYQRGAELAGLPTGFVDLDKKLGGLQPSDLIVVAGRPSMGKTAFALDIADYLARKGHSVGAFSLEMSGEQLSMRMLAQRVEVASERLRRGMISENEFREVVKRAEDIAKLPLIIDESGGLSFAQMASRARRMKRKHRIEALVVDYLQLLHGSRRDSRVQEVAEITTGLKALAKELDVPIIAISQLSRAPEQRSDKRPQLSDLRESGSIEQDADVVMFVYREEYYLEREKPSDADLEKYADWSAKMERAHGKAEIIVAKNRNGPIGSFQLAFDANLTRFSNLASDYLMPEGRHA